MMRSDSMADVNRHPGLDRADSVSALGLRWAALRGMLGSPLIEADDHQALRSDLIRELGSLERDLAAVAARNAIEVAAKIDIVKAALRQAGHEEWISELLESVKGDTRALLETARNSRPERTRADIVRGVPGREPEPAPAETSPFEQTAAE
jgi:hypothetical protein